MRKGYGVDVCFIGVCKGCAFNGHQEISVECVFNKKYLKKMLLVYFALKKIDLVMPIRQRHIIISKIFLMLQFV